MKQTISRTITTTDLKYSTFNVVGGEVEVSPKQEVSIFGKQTLEQSKKQLKKMLAEGVDFTIVDIEYNVNTYEMDLNEFINYATIKEEK